ncbi:hypothetical protein CRYUN_Cryun41cG0055800 [Craigia yunnanensis]
MWCLQKAYQFLCLVLFFLNFQANLSSSSSSITQLCSHDEASALIQFKSSLSIDETYSGYWYCDYLGTISYPKTDSWKEDSKTSSKFSEFASLVYLKLSGSYFVGQVPSQVFHLSKLVSLDLSLKYYYLYQNYHLTLDKHTLEGLVHNLTEVRQLLLDGIYMSFINPNVLMNLSSSLRSFSLYCYGLQGKFPKKHFSPAKPQYAQIRRKQKPHSQSSTVQSEQSSRNFGSILYDLFGEPNSIGNLISLNHLDLRWAHISRSIPRTLGNLSKLNYLNLTENNFSGKIPSSLIRNLTQLEFLDIRDNQLEGSIPDEVLSHLPYLLNLTDLYLSSNNLSGIVEFGMFSKLQNLKDLELSSNSLSLHSNTTSADYTLPNLRYLHLLSCNVSKFPQFLSGSKSLQYLDLSYNRIYGKILKWMWDVGKDTLSYLGATSMEGH